MGFTAGTLVVSGDTLYKKEKIENERNGEGSFQALRQKVDIVNQNKKVRVVDDRLIQYRESAFLSDMLSSFKD